MRTCIHIHSVELSIYLDDASLRLRHFVVCDLFFEQHWTCYSSAFTLRASSQRNNHHKYYGCSCLLQMIILHYTGRESETMRRSLLLSILPTTGCRVMLLDCCCCPPAPQFRAASMWLWFDRERRSWVPEPIQSELSDSCMEGPGERSSSSKSGSH